MSRNAFNGGLRPQLRSLAKALRDQQQFLDDVSVEDLDAMADTLVTAALNGNAWALRELGNAIDD